MKSIYLIILTVVFMCSCEDDSCTWEDKDYCDGNTVKICGYDNYWETKNCDDEGLYCIIRYNADWNEESVSCETKDRAFPHMAVCNPVDLFLLPAIQEYPSYKNGQVSISTEGIGIYYDSKPEGQTGWASWDEDGLAIYYGNLSDWMSFRYELAAGPVSFAGCTGIEFDILVDIESYPNLRLTIADLETIGDVGSDYALDEFWWWDDNVEDVLSKGAYEWIHMSVPFSEFSIGSGYGVRRNNNILDLAYVLAIEFNVINHGLLAEGKFHIKNLRSY